MSCAQFQVKKKRKKKDENTLNDLEFIAQIPTNLGAHDCQFHANLPQFSLSSGPIDTFILSCLL